jgi:hypothetical protein
MCTRPPQHPCPAPNTNHDGVGIMSSLPFDWYARQGTGTKVSSIYRDRAPQDRHPGDPQRHHHHGQRHGTLDAGTRTAGRAPDGRSEAVVTWLVTCHRTGTQKQWSYGDSNPRPLACHHQAAHPPASITAGHRPDPCPLIHLRPRRLLYFRAVQARLPAAEGHVSTCGGSAAQGQARRQTAW